jgi:hypothetical protein
LGESYRSGAAKCNRAGPVVASCRRNLGQKVEGIQALVYPMQAILGFAGKMPGSGVTSRLGMGDNLSEIVV